MSPDARVTEAHRLFGLLLRDRRERVGWSRRVLAKRMRKSEATLKLIEMAQRAASRGTLYALLHIRELELTEDDIAPLAGDRLVEPPVPGLRARANDALRTLHVELSSSADPLTHYQHHRALLRSAGSSLRSCWAYLDPASANDYRRYAMLCPGRAEARGALEQLLPRIVQKLDGSPLDVIALGCGLGVAEVDLTLWLTQQERVTRLSLGLIDLSPPLLAAGYRHAVDAMQDLHWVDVWACAADLEQLTRERSLITGAGRQRLFTLLGETLAELENEDRLIRDTLGALAEPGDLLLLDVELSGASWPEIPALQARMFEWLRGPFERTGHALVSLRLAEPRRGRWAAFERDVVADVPSEERRRRWSCYTLRRYNLADLKARLEEAGWPVLAEKAIGRSPTTALLLCQRAPLLTRDASRAKGGRSPDEEPR